MAAVTMHRIAGSEVVTRHELLPGYGALKVGAPRVWRWGWRHTTVLATLMVTALTVAGANGMLP
jgi:hypothetical protein